MDYDEKRQWDSVKMILTDPYRAGDLADSFARLIEQDYTGYGFSFRLSLYELYRMLQLTHPQTRLN